MALFTKTEARFALSRLVLFYGMKYFSCDIDTVALTTGGLLRRLIGEILSLHVIIHYDVKV